MIDATEMLRRLNDQGVEYVVIGGLAMVTHGASIVTEDLDLCYRRTQTNFEALERAFADLNVHLRDAPSGLPFRLDAPTIHAALNFTLITDLGPVDLIGEVSGVQCRLGHAAQTIRVALSWFRALEIGDCVGVFQHVGDILIRVEIQARSVKAPA